VVWTLSGTLAAWHVNVNPLRGFTDIQEKGPMSHWQHTHTFTAITDTVTKIQDRIEYAYPPGWNGLLTRLLYAPIMLRFLFLYRSWVTKWAVRV